MQAKKMNFFDQLYYAIAKPARYKELTQLKIGYVIGYVLILMFLCSVISFGIPIGGYIYSIGGLTNLFTNRIPAFELKDDTFSIEEPLDFYFNGMHVVADGDRKSFTKEDISKDDISAFMISKSNIFMVSGLYYTEYKFSDLNEAYKEIGESVYVNNDTLVRMIPLFYAWFGVMFLMDMVSGIISYLFMALLFAAFGYTFNLLIDTRLKFGTIIIIALYAETLMVIVTKITTFFIGGPFSFIVWVIMAIITSRLVNMGIASHKLKKDDL